jgi:diguanylate cyclase (GGDEF)-like protein
MTVTDPLTGVYNRRYFDARIAAAINSAKRDDRLLNLAILDIDYFKQYNDSHGHQAGDRVLVAVGELLNTMLKRADDCGFRLGGEEFAMLLNNKSKADAMRFVEQVRQALEGLRITHERSDVSPFVTASFGVVSIPASQAGGFDDLYQMADRLLYEAKRAGRNKVVSN